VVNRTDALSAFSAWQVNVIIGFFFWTRYHGRFLNAEYASEFHRSINNASAYACGAAQGIILIA
jgi:hypothetical protein